MEFWNSQSSFSWHNDHFVLSSRLLRRLLQQKTMITVENDIVAGDVLLWLRGNFYDSFGSIRNGRHLFCFFFVAPAAIRAGSKMGCVELCDFHFYCASIFCQPMKKFEFFGATRATRQRHSKTSSTGDEDASTSRRRRQINKLMSVFYASVLLLIMNFVITLSK